MHFNLLPHWNTRGGKQSTQHSARRPNCGNARNEKWYLFVKDRRWTFNRKRMGYLVLFSILNIRLLPIHLSFVDWCISFDIIRISWNSKLGIIELITMVGGQWASPPCLLSFNPWCETCACPDPLLWIALAKSFRISGRCCSYGRCSAASAHTKCRMQENNRISNSHRKYFLGLRSFLIA